MQWWIQQSRLLGSHNPSKDELDVQGLAAVVSLLDPAEQALLYDPDSLDVKWYSIPVRDFAAPTLEDLLKFIEIVESTEGVVLVHCQGGSGRTGTFGVAWLMSSEGLSADEAITELRFDNPHAVETEEQRNILVRFGELLSGKGVFRN
jgi:protein-tyrosine phosphatase